MISVFKRFFTGSKKKPIRKPQPRSARLGVEILEERTVPTAAKSLPGLAWVPPAAITYGTPLTSVQLDATAQVPGTFSYTLANGTTPASGAVLSAGNNQTLDVAFTPTNLNFYLSATHSVSINVNQATPALSVTGNSTTFDDSADPATPQLTGVNGQAVTTLEGVSPVLTYFAGSPAYGNALPGAPSDAGTYTVFASFPGSADYASTGAASASFTITPAMPQVTISIASGAYTGQPFAASARASDVVTGNSVDGSMSYTYYVANDPTDSGTTTAPTVAGTYTVIASFTSGDPDFTNAQSAPITFTIASASPQVSVSIASGAYTGQPFAASATDADAVTGNQVNGSITCTYFVANDPTDAGTTTAPTMAGTYTVVASFTSSDPDYANAQSAPVTFTITPASPQVSVNIASGPYTGQPFAASTTVSDAVNGAAVNGSMTCTYFVANDPTDAGTTTAPTAPGTYTVVASFTSSDPDYANSQSAPVTFAITPATPQVSVSVASGVYTGQPFAASATATDATTGNSVNGSMTYTYFIANDPIDPGTNTAPTAAGTYIVVASFTSSDPDYANAQSAPVTFEILTPTIALNAQVLPGQEVELFGVVSDDNPAGVVVTFSGAASGSTVTDINGDFDFITTDASLGTVYAAGIDQNGVATNTGSAIIGVTAPALSVAVTTSSGNSVTITGQVSDVDLSGLTVNLSGVVNSSVVTDANGDFSYTGSVNGPGSIFISATDLWGLSSNQAQVNVNGYRRSNFSASVVPQLTLLTQVLPGHEVQLTGTLSDDVPAGATVTFSGAVSGTAITNANGQFTFTTTDATLGTVYAVAVDENGLTSNTASASVAVATPLLTEYVSNVSAGSVTVSGYLNDVDNAGQTIQFSGLASGSAVTNSSGYFSFTANTTGTGELDASATDDWGLTSNAAFADAPAQVLGVLDFEAYRLSGNIWNFEGRVVGASNNSNVQVSFAGLASIAGITIQVADDGTFEMTRTLQAGESGTATATATDTSTGNSSNQALAIVRNS